MPRLPTRKRRNHRNQTGGDATDTIIQSILRDGNVAVDTFFRQEDVEEVVDRILKKDNLPLADATRILELIFLAAIEKKHVHVVQTILKDDRVTAEFLQHERILRRFLNRRSLRDSVDPIFKVLLASPKIQFDVDDMTNLIQMQDTSLVKAMLDEPRIDPSMEENIALTLAIQEGIDGIVELLLKDERIDATAYDNRAVCEAAEHENGYIMRLLLEIPDVDPTVDNNYPIRYASEEGFLEIVEELMRDSRVDPSAEGNAPLLLAIQNNHEEVVMALLTDPRVDPSVDDNQAIQYAAENKNLELISILYCDYPNVSNNKNILEMAREGKYTENVNTHILRLYSDSPEKVCAVDIDSQERLVDISENTLVYTPNMTSYNFIENEEVPIRTELCRRDNILIKATNSFFTLSRSDIEKNLKTHTHIRFECSGEMIPGSFIYSKDVVVNIPYYYIQGIGNFLVTKEQLISAMNTYSIIELVKSGKHIPVLTSYGVVQGEPGRLLDGTPMQDGAYMSADHCQAGTEQNVYDIYGIILS